MKYSKKTKPIKAACFCSGGSGGGGGGEHRPTETVASIPNTDSSSVASHENPISTKRWSESVYGKTPRCSAGGGFAGDGGCCFAGGGGDGGGGGVDVGDWFGSSSGLACVGSGHWCRAA